MTRTMQVAAPVLVLALVFAGLALAQPRPPAAATPSPEDQFFEALTRRPEQRGQATAALTAWVAREPGSARANLLLGTARLWAASGPVAGDAAALDEIILAEHFLARAADLDPADTRITSWLAPARYYRALAEGDPKAAAAALDRQRAAALASPCFHAVALAILRSGAPADSPEFKEALKAMQAAARCAPEDPSVLNRPRWPHNVEGFSVVWADMERKAGNETRAREVLMATELLPSYERWPFRRLTTERLDLRPGAPAPAFALARTSASSCLICHQGP